MSSCMTKQQNELRAKQRLGSAWVPTQLEGMIAGGGVWCGVGGGGG